jgi:enoyl-CoA hydratase/carnithine racemase
MTEAATYQVEDGVAWLVMNRPESANALNQELRQALKGGFERFSADTDAAVLILTGAGDRAFCAGGDLREMADTQLKVPPPDFVPQPGRTIDIPKPIIAAVNGAAYGGGFLLAQSCDLCIAADHARFAISEARWGRGSPWAAPLPYLIPPRVAMELLVTGRPIDAQRAYQVGLVNAVVPAAELRAAAQEMAASIVANAPLSVQAGKELVYSVIGRTRADAWDGAEELYRPVYLSHDAMEGPMAFSERRPPRWSGS